jgi:hypothetical protein
MPQLNRFISRCLFMLVSLTPLTLCQSVDELAAKDEADLKLHSLLVEVRKNPDDPLVELKAIPTLQEAFTSASDAPSKVNIASALMELGQKDDILLVGFV